MERSLNHKILQKYLIKSYSQIFYPIFLTLFAITSIIFLVKIASLTSIIQINFLELLELYSYNIATILFYTIPVSLFISLCLALAKLSSEYELIVVTSFGLNPLQIIKSFLPMLFVSSLLILIISLVLIPKSNFLKDSFINNKQVEAQFNIKASEYGQQFGKWLIYVEKEKNGLYEDIVLYQQNGVEDIFIVAKYAQLDNLGTSLNLTLKEGRVIRVQENLNQVDFKTMILNNQLTQLNDINTFQDLKFYWTIKIVQFSWYVMFSLFPFISAFFIVYIGYFNPRYDKNYSVVIAVGVIAIFIICVKELTKEFALLSVYFFPMVWMLIGYGFYRYKIKPYY